MDDATPTVETPHAPRHGWLWVAMASWVMACLATVVVGFFLESAGVITAGLIGMLATMPFPAIAVVQIGERRQSARAWVVVGWCLAALPASMLVVLSVMAPTQLETGAAKASGARTMIAFALTSIATAAGFCCFLPCPRRFAAQWLPINPQSFTSATALAMVIPLTCYCLIPLAVTGQIPMTAANTKMPEDTNSANIILPGLALQLVYLVLFSIVAGGFPIRRNFHDTLQRLGVERIGPMQLAIGIGVAVLLVVCALPAERGIQRLWTYFGWPQTDEKAMEQWFDGLKSWYGAILVGIVAGISEELLFRGLLQPRLGLMLSNLLFTAGHAFQYHWDGLLAVFLIGLVCGLVKKRYNTTTSMIVHGLYDTITVLLATYAGEYFK